ncbi:MAG TPA: hypothetical protein VMV91_18090 [Rhodocyclaceae bacterium]|nr:hypothetical protein [Rhodocyclaceae bacterium]
MNTIKWMTALLLLLAAAGSASAWADRDHGHFDAHFGMMIGPYWGPGYYAQPPYGYYPPPYPPVLVAPPAPPVYIEQQAPAAPAPTDYWYYCPAAKAYYPYVKECPGGWQKVSPQPPDRP